MIPVLEKFLSYLSVVILVTMLSGGKIENNVKSVGGQHSNLHNYQESVKFMRSFLAFLEKDGLQMENGTDAFLEKLGMDKVMQTTLNNLIQNFVDDFNSALVDIYAKSFNIAGKKISSTPKDSYPKEGLNQDKKRGSAGKGKTAHTVVIAVTNDIQVHDFPKLPSTNPPQNYSHENNIYIPLRKEKTDRPKMYRQNREDYDELEEKDILQQALVNQDLLEAQTSDTLPDDNTPIDQYAYVNEDYDEEDSDEDESSSDEEWNDSNIESSGDEGMDGSGIESSGDKATDDSKNESSGDGSTNDIVIESSGDEGMNDNGIQSRGNKATDDSKNESSGDGSTNDSKNESSGDGSKNHSENESSGDGSTNDSKNESNGDGSTNHSENKSSGDGSTNDSKNESSGDGSTNDSENESSGDGSTNDGGLKYRGDGSMDDTGKSFSVEHSNEKDYSTSNKSKNLTISEPKINNFTGVSSIVSVTKRDPNNRVEKNKKTAPNKSANSLFDQKEKDLKKTDGEELIANQSTVFLKRKLLEFNQEVVDNNDFNSPFNERNIAQRKVPSRPKAAFRVKRSYDVDPAMLKKCQIPPSMETVQGFCKAIPIGITCNLYCIKGYTFPEGISRELKCDPTVGWDKQFEECKPYADCTLRLRSGGTLDCALTTASENAKCYISCRRNGLYRGQGRRLYQCNSLGLWTPILPHCVVREGIDLVDPPLIFDHESINYP